MFTSGSHQPLTSQLPYINLNKNLVEIHLSNYKRTNAEPDLSSNLYRHFLFFC